ncbi:cysteine peptidase family C39 domain-containing protein [Epilithonimonas sp. UC225_85]|uniref:cysteine peptidase family C39 domain-containing protein n=1 Tax=Epilithonimonas sp. UC225_85 TaxID=3350167 RepID=UPI0036D39126
MNNLLKDIEDFDEESQKILKDIASSGKALNFKNQPGTLKSIALENNSTDYRSPFHDYRETPLGYSYLTDNPVSIFASTGINEKGEKGIEYYAEVQPCKNGSEVYRNSEANARKDQALFLFYEKPDVTKSNFAGPFYIARMGGYFVSMFKYFPKPIPSKINGKFFKDITSLQDEASYLSQLAYTYEKDKIDATAVYQALRREYQYLTNDKQLDELLGNISSIPADAIGWCADKLENLKPSEKNYDPESKEYTPIIPVLGVPVPVNMSKAAQFFENLGDNPFVQGADAAFTKVWDLVKQAASKIKDASIEHLPESFKKLVTKINGIINTIKDFLSDAIDSIIDLDLEILKLANAFYCGIISGLISLLQCLLYILEFLLQPTLTFSYKQYLERRDLLEKAEDVLDWIHENGPKFLQGVKDLFKGSGDFSLSDMEGALDKMKAYWDGVSRYTVAFYVGVLGFEVLINVLLLFFTEGAGNVVKGATYVEKMASLLRTLGKETVSVVTMGITDLLAFLSKFIIRFGKACAKGFRGFIKFIEELLQGAKNGAKAEDLAEDVQDIEEVILKGKKPRNIFDIGRNVRFGFRDLGIEIIAKADGYLLKWKEKPIFKGDHRELRYFWEKILQPKIRTGTGGVLKYLEVLSRDMLAQEHSMSCAAACIRQLAKDKGIEMSEAAIRKLAGTTEEMGTFEKGMSDAAKKIFKDNEFSEGTIDHIPVETSELIKILSKKNPWIAWIKESPNGGNHAIIIDKFENGLVHIRDPWPIEGISKGKGVKATIKLEDFESAWNRTGKYAFWFKN